MADPTATLQTSLVARYRSDPVLQSLMTGASAPEYNIFDQGGGGVLVATFPYVLLHPIQTQSGATMAFGTDAVDSFVQVSVFTKTQGFAQARTIAARIYALTHGLLAAPLSLPGFATVLMLFDNRQELEEISDGLIQQVVDRYKFFVQG